MHQKAAADTKSSNSWSTVKLPAQIQQQLSTETSSNGSQSTQTLFTVDQFSNLERVFTPPALRNLIFKAETRKTWKGEIPGNGLIECGAIIRVGRKVLIDGEKFLNWVRQQNKGGQ